METKPAESTGTIGAAAQRMGFVSHLHPGCTCTHEAGQPCDASCAVHAPDATAKPAPATTYALEPGTRVEFVHSSRSYLLGATGTVDRCGRHLGQDGHWVDFDNGRRMFCLSGELALIGPATAYTIRSEGGSLTAPGSDRRAEAMAAASALAAANEGQRIILYRNGHPVRTSSMVVSWTSGPRAEVQR